MNTITVDRPFDNGSYFSLINKTSDSVAAQVIIGNTAANPTVVTVEGHGIIDQRNVTISGNTTSTPAINGVFKATVIDADTFSIEVNVTIAGSDGTLKTEVGTVALPRHVTYYSDYALNISSITSASPAVVTFTEEHLLINGEYVFFIDTDSTPSLNGGRFVTVISSTTVSVGVTTTIAGTADTGSVSPEKLIRKDLVIDGYDSNLDPIFFGNVIESTTFNIAEGKFEFTSKETIEAIEAAQRTNNFVNLPVFDTRFTSVSQAGHSTTLLSTLTDINDSGNTNWLLPGTATILSIVSTSTQDGGAGAGISAILLQGLDQNLDEIVDVVVMNGTTPVLSNIPFRSMHSSIALSGGTPGAGSIGTINISSVADATVWAAYVPGDTAGETGRYIIPNGKRFVLTGVIANSGAAGDMTMKTELTLPGAFPISLAELYLGSQLNVLSNITILQFEAGTMIKFRGFTNTGSPATRKIHASLTGVVGTVEAWDSLVLN